MKKEKYSTFDLNIAAYLRLSGMECRIQAIIPGHAKFTFDDSKALREQVERFLKGKAEVNVAAYMFTRLTLKREGNMHLQTPRLRKAGVSALPAQNHVIAYFAPAKGMSYWYTENGSVFNGVFKDEEPHRTRVAEMRTFSNKKDAVASLSKK